MISNVGLDPITIKVSDGTKCDGRRPQCWQCSHRSLPCSYLDIHARISRLTYIEAQQKLQAYDEVFRILQTKGADEGAEILSRIRSGDSVERVLRHLQDADLLLQLHVAPEVCYQYTFPYRKDMPQFLLSDDNPYLDSLLYKHSALGNNGRKQRNITDTPNGNHDPYDIPLHAAEVVDPRLDAIDAQNWTSVTDDKVLLVALLKVYLLTEYTWHPSFDKDHFLDDMVSGRKRFCSSFLVNAILASACVSTLPLGCVNSY